MTSYLRIDSILLEAWDPEDENANPLLLPKGAYIEVVKTYTNRKTQTGAPQTLYWLRFPNDPKLWLCAPNWWQAVEVSEKPKPTQRQAPKEHIANGLYKLVRISE